MKYSHTQHLKIVSLIALSLLGVLFITPSTRAESIDSIEKDIKEYEATLGTLHEEKASLQNEIDQFENEIKKTESEITLSKKKLKKLEDNIELAQTKIHTTENTITIQKETLKDFIQLIDQADDTTYIEAIFSANSLSGIVNNIQYSSSLQDETKNTLTRYQEHKTALEEKKNAFNVTFEETEVLLSMLSRQERDLDLKKQNKEILLEKTEGEEGKYQDLFNDAQDKKQEALITFLSNSSGEGSISISDAANYAEIASSKTGVRKEVIMAIIEQETFFGRNVGTGYYKQDMKPAFHTYFEQICADLGINPETSPVSKKPQTYQGWGGAMGYAQIMPPEWIRIRKEISTLTGHSNPSPWNPADAFMGAGILLRDKGAASPSTELEGIGRYFAGGYWQKYTWYATSVLEKAKKYE